MKAGEGEEAGDAHDSPNFRTPVYTKVATNITVTTTKEKERESD